MVQCSAWSGDDSEDDPMQKAHPPRILFLGDSLTEGFRLQPEESFPHLVQNWLRESGYSYQVINGGVSGDTTSDALQRIHSILDSYPGIEIVYIFLGANDFFQGLSGKEVQHNLVLMIEAIRKHDPEIRILLVQFPVLPSMIPGHGKTISSAFTEAANQMDVLLVEFPMEGIFQNPALSQPDGVHPSAEGMKLVAGQVIKTLKRELLENRKL